MSALLIFLRAAGSLLVALLIAGALLVPAQAQDLGKRGHKQQPSSAEKHPTVSEKDYKAALEKIPDPKQKYDPWGAARPNGSATGASEPPKGAKKAN